MPSWLKKIKNDAEASSSRRIPLSPPPVALLRELPPAPRPEDYLTQPTRVIVPPKRQRWNRRYVPLEECERRWRDNEGIDHNNDSLPSG
jgi:hypothetical protein